MSLLKKIFGGSSTQEEHKKSLTDRSPRVAISALHKLNFTPSSGGANATFSLSNISASGMGLIHEENSGFIVGQPIRGLLVVGSDDFNVEAFIKHVSKRMAGCHFIGENSALRKTIENYFRVEISALNLRAVAGKFLKPDPRGELKWFTDGNHNEVYCVSDKQGLCAFHMTFLGNYVEWERGSKLIGGTIKEDNRLRRLAGSSLVDIEQVIPSETLELAKVFNDNVQDIGKELRESIRNVLNWPPKP